MAALVPKIEAKLDGSNWTDISADVIAPVTCSSGIFGNAPTDRVASIGQCTFQLKNSAANSAGLNGYYTPGHTNCRTGFDVGLLIRVTFTFDYNTVTKWYGRIAPDGIIVDPWDKSSRRTTVTAYDWMYQAEAHTLYLPSYTTNKRMDEVLPLIVANMPIAPLANSYATGQDTFSSVFDTVRYNTTAMAEMNKLAMSEPGFIYLRHDDTSDETLVSEDRYYRNEITTISTIPSPSSSCGHILQESGDALLQEGGDYLLLSELETITLENKMVGLEYSYGANLYNRIEVATNPKKVDAAATTVLWTLQKRIEIAAGETLTGIRSVYRDPTGGAKKVAGINMVTPVKDTDYWMDSVENSDAKDLSDDLTVTVTYGTEGAEYTLVNGGASTGYVYLQARGKGVYIYDVVNRIYEDSTSINKHGTLTLNLDMKYQDDPVVSDGYGNVYLNTYKNPTACARTVTFLTSSDELRSVFLIGDCGKKITVTESQTGIDENYFINGWEFEIMDKSYNTGNGSLVRYTYYLKKETEDVYLFAEWDTHEWDSEYYWAI